MKEYAHLALLIHNLYERGISHRAIAGHLNEIGDTTRVGAAITALTVIRILDRVG